MTFINIIIGIIFVVLVIKVIRDILIQKEGFSYSSCINDGYTKEFCSQRSIPGLCQCPNGLIGRIDRSFGGACVCSYYTPPIYPIPTIF